MASVVGGASSIQGNLEELERGSQFLKDIAVRAGVLGAKATAWSGALSFATVTVPSGAQVRARAVEVSSGLAWLATESYGLAEGVDFAVAGYRQAERVVEEQMSSLMLAVSGTRMLGDLVTGQDIRTEDLARLLEDGPEAVLNLLHVGFSPAGGLALGTVANVTEAGLKLITDNPELSQTEALWMLAGGVVGTAGLLRVGRYDTTNTTKGDTDAQGWAEAGRADGSIAWLLKHQEGSFPENAGESSMQVGRITLDSGEEVYTVSYPGSQFDDLDISDPDELFNPQQLLQDFGFEENAWGATGMREGMTLGSQHVADATVDILAEAGVPEGAKVIFSGYSQGGMHASTVATNPKITDVYDVEAVVTYGAPDHHVDHDPDTIYLGFQHIRDRATALSGPVPDGGVNHSRVILEDLPAGADPAESGAFGAGHSWHNLEEMTRDAAADPVVRGQLEHQLQHLSGITTGAVATKTYSLQRRDPGAPRNPLDRIAEGAHSVMQDVGKNSRTLSPTTSPLGPPRISMPPLPS
ncbi:hypothetical protein QDX21_11240 [Auritidibacter ignavus]|uniref:PE-PPE domain-containing protein n=1 Tax=Auritidibacter ignavus TaxID=678932 RepID=A0AAJ6AGC8_9MICC|nr:hypothetical protein [Auritidibacter ignavus]WGH92856.1 hypothetical protein QDX21_11240 [Auritidibacter ignavus]